MAGDRQHGHGAPDDFIEHRERKSPQHPMSVSFGVGGPAQRRSGDRIHRVEHCGTKHIGQQSNALAVPGERLLNIAFGRGGNHDNSSRHSASSRARASLQGVTLAAPDSSLFLWRRISSAHTRATVASSSPSRLSSKARTTAERSSGASCSAASIKWYTRAFICRSLPTVGFCRPALRRRISHSNRTGILPLEHRAQPQVRHKRLEIPVAVKQRVAVFDAARRNHSVDRLANRHAECPERAVVLGRLNRDAVPA